MHTRDSRDITFKGNEVRLVVQVIAAVTNHIAEGQTNEGMSSAASEPKQGFAKRMANSPPPRGRATGRSSLLRGSRPVSTYTPKPVGRKRLDNARPAGAKT